MRNLDDRVARVRSLQRAMTAQARRRTDKLALAVVALASCVPLLMVALDAGGASFGSVQILFGASLFGDGAGGYVFVGIVSFAAAVAITLACLKHRSRRDAEGIDHPLKR